MANANANGIGDMHAANQQLMAENAILKSTAKAGVELLAATTLSKKTAKEMVMNQVLRTHLPIGGEVPEGKEAVLKDAMGLTDLQYRAQVRRFKAGHPRYDETHQNFVQTNRKCPEQKPKVAARETLANHCVVIDATDRRAVREIKRRCLAAENDIYTAGVRAIGTRFSRHEARRYMVGYILTKESHNARQTQSNFAGRSTTVVHDRP